MEYNLIEPWKSLDPWQEEVLNTKGHIVLRSGRQTGKSTIISIKAGEVAVHSKNKNILIIAKVERQALHLFEKVLNYIYDRYKHMIKGKPTKHELNLRNGSKILCLPTGDSGYGVRGFTVDLLIADEAAFISDQVWSAVTPMISITKGEMWLLSTPFGKQGFFYRAFSDKRFTQFHVSSLDCPRRDEDHLKAERERMTKAQFAQEYLGEFVDELHRFFPDQLINRCCVLEYPKVFNPRGNFYMGMDVARMGEDESTFEVLEMIGDELLQRDHVITTKTLTTETTELAKKLDRKYNFKRIYIDDGGMGVGVFDNLLEDPQTKRKIVAVNNARRSLEHSGVNKPQRKKLLKEDLYNNLLRLMEQRRIFLFKNEEIRLSLRSIQYEYGDKGLRIYGNYSHIVEGLIRAAYSLKDKHLNIFITTV
jgi:hypothetical protein